MAQNGSGLFQKIAVGVICLGVLSYSVYHLSSLFSDEVAYIIADTVTEETSLNVNGYVFRDEIVLTSDYTGPAEYSYADGTKIREGQKLATVYEKQTGSSPGQAVRVLSNLNRQIAMLEKCLCSGRTMADLEEIRENARDYYCSLLNIMALGEISNLQVVREKFLAALFEINRLEKGEGDIKVTLDSLYAAKNAILESSGAKKMSLRARAVIFTLTPTDLRIITVLRQ